MQQEFISKKKIAYRSRKKRKLNKEKALSAVVILLTLFFIGFSLVNYAKNRIDHWLVQLTELQEGEIINTLSMQGVILKEETLVYAPASGQLEIIAVEGERIGVGGIIAKIIGGYDSQFGNRDEYIITAPVAGVVSYEIDGMEEILQRNDYWDLSLNNFPEANMVQIVLQDLITKGQPIVKIINNLMPVNIIAAHDTGDLMELINDETSVLLKLGDSSLDYVHTSLIDARTGENNTVLLLETKGFYEELINLRQVKVEVVLEYHQGLIINERAIVYEHETPGLITVGGDNSFQWHPIGIEGRIDDELLISGLKKGTVYVSNPK